jgi:PAS domain S-box-containing protein
LFEITRNFRSLLNLLLDPAMVIDFEGNLVATNDRLYETTGFRKDELERKNLLGTDFISQRSRIFLLKKCLNPTENSSIDKFEIEAKKKNGERMFIEVMMSEIVCKSKVAKLVVFHDITDRSIREIALRDSDSRYQKLCEDIKILVLTTDLKGNICFANEVAETYGFIVDDATGKNITDFVSKVNRSKLISIHLSVVSGRKVQEEIEIITSNGIFTVDYFSSPIRKEDRITGCLISMIDITDRKQIMKKFEKYSDSALELKKAYHNLGI